MMVQLLPIFLVANLSVNESDWKYGPELIYDVSMNGTEYRIVDETTSIFVHNTTMKLKCRPKNQTNFRCHFHEPRLISSIVKSDGTYRTINDSKLFRDKNPFLVNYFFDFNGDRDSCDVSPYLASWSMSKHRLNIARALMNTINVPDYLIKLNQGKVEIFENSTVGIKCKTDYTVNPLYLSDDIDENSENGKKCKKSYVVNPKNLPDNFEDKKNRKRSYEILLACGEKIREGRGHLISRYVDPRKCWGLIMSGIYSYHYPETIYRLWARTDMIISKNNFFSKYNTGFNFVPQLKPTDVHPIGEETISLSLENIVPASEPLPVIRDSEMYDRLGSRVFL